MTLSGSTPVTVNSVLTSNTESILEGAVVHNTATFTLTIEFGTQSETCRKSVQDISIYFEQCHPVCASNDCPNTEPYYKHPLESRCVSDCPDGFILNGFNCVTIEFCHSTCDTCSLKADVLKCLTCSSSISSLTFNAFASGQT